LTVLPLAQNKHTPNVRKILQSQKTFANHLDDYQAMLALAESNPAAAAAMNAALAKPSTPTTAASKSASPAPTAASAGGSKRSAAAAKRAAAKEKQEQEKKKARRTPKAEQEPEAEPQQPQQQPQPEDDQTDVEMLDATAAPTEPTPTPGAPEPPAPQPSTYPRESLILPAYAKPPPQVHPGDADPLLVSHVPPFPSDDELRALMTAPPLSYLEARAEWGGGDEEGSGSRYPVRVFCAVCGYWGRVKCMKCGTRVCALECLEAHREECVSRYGL
jgi:zinc finger HIT domain-containing protein 1